MEAPRNRHSHQLGGIRGPLLRRANTRGPPSIWAGSINITPFGDPVPEAAPLDAPGSVWLLKVHSCLKAWSVNLLDEAYKPVRNLCKTLAMFRSWCYSLRRKTGRTRKSLVGFHPHHYITKRKLQNEQRVNALTCSPHSSSFIPYLANVNTRVIQSFKLQHSFQPCIHKGYSASPSRCRSACKHRWAGWRSWWLPRPRRACCRRCWIPRSRWRGCSRCRSAWPGRAACDAARWQRMAAEQSRAT